MEPQTYKHYLYYRTKSSATIYTNLTLTISEITKSSSTPTSIPEETSGLSNFLLLTIYLYLAIPEPSPIPSFISFASMVNLLL